MGEKIGEAEDPWYVGQEIEIIDGPFNGFKGVIFQIDAKKRKARVHINFFGRETPVELDFIQMKAL